jgi:hypothetical protein
MSRNINAQATLLTSVAAADVAIAGGELTVKGVGTINLKKVIRTERVGAYTGSNVETNTITVNTATAGVTYSGSITQVVEGSTYTWPFAYTAVSGDTTSTIATALELKIQEGIDGGQILGTVSPSTNTIIFVGTAVAPVAGVIVSSLMSNAKTYTVSWTAAGSTYTAGSSVLTGFSGLVTGDVYKIYMGTGATGNNAVYVNGQTLVGRAASATTMVLYGVPSDTLTTTGITGLAVLAIAKETFADLLAGEEDSFVSGTPYVGYQIQFESIPDLEAGLNISQAIVFSATETNALAFDRALIPAFNGSLANTTLWNTFA